MRRVLLITMGTSLFHSATWEPRGAAAEVEGYRRWVERDDLRESPEARKQSREATKDELEAALRSGAPEDWAALLPADLLDPAPARRDGGRYSAELTTILRLSVFEGGSPAAYLAGFDRVLLVADPVKEPLGKGGPLEPRASYVAATHLCAYLRRIAPDVDCDLLEVSHLAGSRAGELEKGLEGLQQEVSRILSQQDTELHCIVTGGFKVYGYFLAPMVSQPEVSMQLLYTHEDGDEVIRLERGKLVLLDEAGPRSVSFAIFDRGI